MIVDEHNFTINGIDFNAKIEGNQADNTEKIKISVSHDLDGMHVCYVLEIMAANMKGDPFNCTYERHLINPVNDKSIDIRKGRFLVTAEEFHQFFFTPTGAFPMGVVLGRNLINGICFQENNEKVRDDKSTPKMGWRPFDGSMAPQNLVDFDHSVTSGTDQDTFKISLSITSWNQATTTEETPSAYTVEYKLNGNDYEAPLVDATEIDNLTSNNYTVKVTLSTGQYMERTFFVG